MELKLIKFFFIIVRFLFESHLYGIETGDVRRLGGCIVAV